MILKTYSELGELELSAVHDRIARANYPFDPDNPLERLDRNHWIERWNMFIERARMEHGQGSWHGLSASVRFL